MRSFDADGAGGSGTVEPPGYRALAAGCALAAAPPSSGLVLTGEDRARFLHGQTTCDVAGLEPGRGVYGFFVSPKGRVLADAVISAEAERLVVELPAGAAIEIAERLRRYVVADRVEIEVAAEPAASLLVAGPRAAAALAPLIGAEAPAGWDHLETGAGDSGLAVRGELRLGIPAWRLAGAPPAVDGAAAALGAAGAGNASPAALEAIRVERGVPRAGVDFDERHFPQETGLEDWAVSYTKGCYIGQEVVARIHYRGRVNHRLSGLMAAPGAAPAPLGALVDGEGAEAGGLSSSVWSPALGRAVGLAILHRRWAEPGTRLDAADGSRLEVAPLPFVDPGAAP